MSIGPDAQPVDELAVQCRLRVAEALAARDGYGAYVATKGWVTHGGVARVPAPWLVHAAGALLQRQLRTAVHALDLGLQHWVQAAPDRSILLWARGSVIMRYLADPKTALADFSAAGPDAPRWLLDHLDGDLTQCQAAALISRKRKPSVAPAPAWRPRDTAVANSPPHGHRPGQEPELWAAVEPLLIGPDRP